jgi:hypothetical protein
METLWPGSFVEEANLTVAISLLRKVLGEKQGSLRYIETVPKKVYRLIAAVTEGSAIPPEEVLFGETRIAESLPDLSLRAGNLAPSEVELTPCLRQVAVKPAFRTRFTIGARNISLRATVLPTLDLGSSSGYEARTSE